MPWIYIEDTAKLLDDDSNEIGMLTGFSVTFHREPIMMAPSFNGAELLGQHIISPGIVTGEVEMQFHIFEAKPFYDAFNKLRGAVYK